MDYNDILNQAIYDAETEDMISEELNNELERIWKLKLIEAWKLIREYEMYIEYCERIKNEWILRQIDIDAQWQIDWKAEWKEHYSQPYAIRDDVWESNWNLAMYTRHVSRKTTVAFR